VCIKLVALRINRYPRSSSHFQKGWWLRLYCIQNNTKRFRQVW